MCRQPLTTRLQPSPFVPPTKGKTDKPPSALQIHLTDAPPPLPAQPSPPHSPSASTTPLPRKKSFAFLRSNSKSTSTSASSPSDNPDSAMGASGGGRGEVHKLPKEFLVEFWQILASSPSPSILGYEGEEAWVGARSGFLRGIKKGSRSEGGGNLREVGVLLESEWMWLQSFGYSGGWGFGMG